MVFEKIKAFQERQRIKKNQRLFQEQQDLSEKRDKLQARVQLIRNVRAEKEKIKALREQAPTPGRKAFTKLKKGLVSLGTDLDKQLRVQRSMSRANAKEIRRRRKQEQTAKQRFLRTGGRSLSPEVASQAIERDVFGSPKTFLDGLTGERKTSLDPIGTEDLTDFDILSQGEIGMDDPINPKPEEFDAVHGVEFDFVNGGNKKERGGFDFLNGKSTLDGKNFSITGNNKKRRGGNIL